jgi:hypothetical protein
MAKKILLNNESIEIIKETLEYMHASDATLDKYRIGLEEEINASQINLKSFDLQRDLNERIWINDKINSRVRLRLLDIADAYFEDLMIPWVKIKDIQFVGSLAAYTWSKYSDIDIHIIIDFKDVDVNVQLVREYFDTKEKRFNELHSDLTIYGFPIEIYTQDINEILETNGIYSLEKNEWIKFPQYSQDIKLQKDVIKTKSSLIINKIIKIDELYSKYKVQDDDYKLEILNNMTQKLYKAIKAMRKEGLNREGENSWENIVFKVLRRSEYMGFLIKLKTKIYDKINSIK